MNGLTSVDHSTPTRIFRLPGGEPVTVRVISPQDTGRLQAYIRNLSGPTRRNRFLGAVNELTPSALERLAHMGGPDELTLIAFAGAGSQAAMIAEAVEVMAPQSRRCEIALSVTDAWQRKGLGTLLLATLERHARLLSARCLVGEVLRTNDAVKALARKAGFAIRGPFSDARLVEIVKDLSIRQTALPCHEQFFQLRSVAA